MSASEINATGRIIEEECSKKGWSITDLAKFSGVPKTTIHSWTGGRTPNLNQLKKVSMALDLSFHYLAFGESDPKVKEQLEGGVSLTELFQGDLRITVHKILK